MGVSAIFDRGAMPFEGPIGAQKWPSGAPNEGVDNNHNLADLHRTFLWGPFYLNFDLDDIKLIPQTLLGPSRGPFIVILVSLASNS